MALYEPNLRLKEMSFEEALLRISPRLRYFAASYQNFLPNFDGDDISQELTFKFWQVWKNWRFPADMRYFDWRFLRYVNAIFLFHLYDLHRKYAFPHPRGGEPIYRDFLNNCRFVFRDEQLKTEFYEYFSSGEERGRQHPEPD